MWYENMTVLFGPFDCNRLLIARKPVVLIRSMQIQEFKTKLKLVPQRILQYSRISDSIVLLVRHSITS